MLFCNTVLTSCNFLYEKWWLAIYSSPYFTRLRVVQERILNVNAHACSYLHVVDFDLFMVRTLKQFLMRVCSSKLCSPDYFHFESIGTLLLPSILFGLWTRKIGFLLQYKELFNGTVVSIWEKMKKKFRFYICYFDSSGVSSTHIWMFFNPYAIPIIKLSAGCILEL